MSANVLANALSGGVERAPWLGLALWAAILLTSFVAASEFVKRSLAGSHSSFWPANRTAMFPISIVSVSRAA